MTTPVIIDIVILIVLVVFTVLGARRGLLCSLAGLVILAVALVGANLVSTALTEPAVELLSPLVERRMEKKVDAALAEREERAENLTIEELLELVGVDSKRLDDLAGRAHNAVRDEGVDIAMAVVESLAYSFIHALLFGLTFLALLVVLKLVAGALDLMLRLPVLRTLNRTGGAMIGLLQGLVVVILVLWVASRLGYPVEQLAEGSNLIQYLAAQMGKPLSQR